MLQFRKNLGERYGLLHSWLQNEGVPFFQMHQRSLLILHVLNADLHMFLFTGVLIHKFTYIKNVNRLHKDTHSTLKKHRFPQQ